MGGPALVAAGRRSGGACWCSLPRGGGAGWELRPQRSTRLGCLPGARAQLCVGRLQESAMRGLCSGNSRAANRP